MTAIKGETGSGDKGLVLRKHRRSTMFFQSALLHIMCAFFAVNTTVGYCPFGWVKHQKTCYRIFPADPYVRSADKAAEVCEKHGGALMNLYTEELNNMATVLLKPLKSDAAAIGLNDRDHEGDYRWGDGKKAAFFNWGPKEPGPHVSSEDCVLMKKPGIWKDVNCNEEKWYQINSACEKPIKEHIVVPPQKRKTCVKK